MSADQRLRELEAQLAAIRRTATDAILILDDQGRVESCNRASERIFGYPIEEISGSPIPVLIPAVGSSPNESGIVAGQRDLAGRKQDGVEFPIRVTVGEFCTEGIRRFVVIVHDISMLKNTEAELRQREELLDLTIEHAPTGIATVDLQGRFLTVNAAFCTMLGYSAAELVDRPVNSVTHPDDVAAADKRLRQFREGRIDEYRMRKRYVRKDGAIVESYMNACLIRGARGQPMMYVGQAEDLTQRLEAERLAKESQDRLAHVTRLQTLGEMAAGIAHEINQPLTAISNYAHAGRRLLDSSPTDKQQLSQALEKITLQAERAGDVIRRLRNFVRKRSSARTIVHVDQLVRDAVRLAEVDAAFHDLSIELQLGERLPAVLADPVQIQQVLLNLLRNAMEAMEAPDCSPRILTVRAEAADETTLVISVQDRGEGISAEVERQLFTTFFTTKSFGLGLGLAISRSILESHGGRLWFTRNADRGATFHISLPAVAEGFDEQV